MTISAHESAISATAILSSSGHGLPFTGTRSQFPAHELSIVAQPSDTRWITGCNSRALQSGLPDWNVWLRRTTLEYVGRSVNDVWIGAGSSTMPTKIMDLTESTDDLYPNLREALQDLDSAEVEAREEGFRVPSGTALRNARWLLRAMFRIFPRRFEVYPMSDGEIAIHVPGAPGHSVLLLCESDGGALCSVNFDGEHRRKRYADSEMHRLPDQFVRAALSELEARDHADA